MRMGRNQTSLRSEGVKEPKVCPSARSADSKEPKHTGWRQERDTAATRPSASPARLPATVDTVVAGRVVFQAARRLLRRQLTANALKCFGELAGLPLHAVWHDSLECPCGLATPILCPTARGQRKPRAPVPPRCLLCMDDLWVSAEASPDQPRIFTGRCGRANCCATLAWRDSPLLTLVLEVRFKRGRKPRLEARPSLAAKTAADSGADTKGGSPRQRDGACPADSSALRPGAFQRAVTLLRLLHHDLLTTLQNHLLHEELARVSPRFRPLEAPAAPPRPGRRGGATEAPASSTPTPPGNQREHIVQAMLEWMRQHYQRPMSLDELAQTLRMNPSYLSTLFHKTTGITFHHHLDDLRMSKARQLLRDPSARICEVACAVGYASPDHFRRTFKAHTGLSPGAWRTSLPPGGFAAAALDQSSAGRLPMPS